MSPALLDAGVWLAALDRGDRFHGPARDLIAPGDGVAALDLSLYEVANVAISKWGSRAKATRAVELVSLAAGGAIIRADPALLDAASAFAARQGITVYDAAYVVAAERAGARLVSTDLKDLVSPGFAISPAEALGPP